MTERYINPHTDFGFKLLMDRPATLQERVFTRLFEQAEISKFNPQELKSYEDSVNAYRDIVNAIKTAEKKKYAEGKAEGMAKGMAKGRAEGIEKVGRKVGRKEKRRRPWRSRRSCSRKA